MRRQKPCSRICDAEKNVQLRHLQYEPWIGYVAEIDAMANEYAIIASAANGNHEGWIILN